MNNKKLKAVLLTLSLGIGLSGVASAYPNESVCRHLEAQCDAGSQTACSSFGKWCGMFP